MSSFFVTAAAEDDFFFFINLHELKNAFVSPFLP